MRYPLLAKALHWKADSYWIPGIFLCFCKYGTSGNVGMQRITDRVQRERERITRERERTTEGKRER